MVNAVAAAAERRARNAVSVRIPKMHLRRIPHLNVGLNICECAIAAANRGILSRLAQFDGSK
jgi:hypothetical protein